MSHQFDEYRKAMETINDKYPGESLNPKALRSLDAALLGFLHTVVDRSSLGENEKLTLRAMANGLFLSKYQLFSQAAKK